MTVNKNHLFTRFGLLIVSLFLILFVGRGKNSEGETSLQFMSDGRESYRLGMDIAGGSKLMYKVDYTKYKQQFTDDYSFNKAKNAAESIILQQIDHRISKLGVSDYTARPLELSNGEHYIQIELGGVQDIEEAKAIIGKTVELEFKLANDKEPTSVELEERRQRAEGFLQQALSNSDMFDSLAQNLQSEDIFYRQRDEVSPAQLPNIYAQIPLDTMKTGEVYNQLVSGLYSQTSDPNGGEGKDINGFVIVKLLDTKQLDNDVISPQQLTTYAISHEMKLNNDIVSTQPTISANTLTYDADKQQIQYNAGEVGAGQQAYKVAVYQGTGSKDDVITSVENGTVGQSLYDGRIDVTQLNKLVPGFTYTPDQKWYTMSVTGETTVVRIDDTKAPSDHQFALLTIDDISSDTFNTVQADLQKQKLYTIQEIFVKDKPSWRVAADPQNGSILDAKHFEVARSSTDQLGNAVTQINFNDEGKTIFCHITEANIQKQMAIFVGGTLVSAPVIQAKICGGSTIIQGDFTGQTCYRKNGSTYPAEDHREGVKCMVENLNEGALPAPLILTQEEKVSPTLGHRALIGVIWAGIAGFVLIFLYMFYLYGLKKATISLIVLLSFMIFLLALLKIIGFVVSLSGLAALILTIGMSVDATILMFERMNEERRTKSIESSIVEGCHRSRPAIRDGNLSTGLIALLLAMMGINVFKGFGMMMLFTIAIILIMIVPVTKLLLLLMSKETDK